MGQNNVICLAACRAKRQQRARSAETHPATIMLRVVLAALPLIDAKNPYERIFGTRRFVQLEYEALAFCVEPLIRIGTLEDNCLHRRRVNSYIAHGALPDTMSCLLSDYETRQLRCWMNQRLTEVTLTLRLCTDRNAERALEGAALRIAMLVLAPGNVRFLPDPAEMLDIGFLSELR
jgi:hypothetical protein